jgi:Tfp pilus assembly protein PilO
MKLDLGVKLGEKEKKLLAVLGTVIILFVAWQFFISPEVDKIQTLSDEVDSNKAQRDELRAKFIHLRDLKEQLKIDKLKVSKLKEVVPENINTEDVLDNITNLWKQSGVALSSGVTISDPAAYTPTAGVTAPAGLMNRTVQVSVTGSYNNILAFIKNIEGSRLKFAITNYSLNSGDKGQLSAAFSLSTFTYNPSNKAGTNKVIDEIPKFGDFNLFAAGGKSSHAITAPNTSGINTKGATPYTGLVNQGSSVVGVGLGNSTTVTSAGNSGVAGTGTEAGGNNSTGPSGTSGDNNNSTAEGKGTVGANGNKNGAAATEPKGAVNIKAAKVDLSKIGMDFYCIVNPPIDDAPVLTVGKFPHSYSEVYSELNGKEKVTISLYKQNGKLYYKYSTSKSSYPQAPIEFKPSGSKIIFKVISSTRTGKDDKASVDLDISNTTGIELDTYIISDDADSPRVNVVKKSGNVNVSNQ